MAKERLEMHAIKELYRLSFEQELSPRQVAKSIGCGRSTIRDYLARAEAAGITEFKQISNLSETEILVLLGLKHGNTGKFVGGVLRKESMLPDCEYLHRELKKKHVTLMLLWSEYRESNVQGYCYTQFCEHYRRWQSKLSVVFRIDHKAGEKVFVDYAGTAINIVDAESGEVRPAQVFVGTLGASSYIFAEATWSQAQSNWLMSHRRMFEYFGGVPEIIVPDNLKSGVDKPDRYESKINRAYWDLAIHYGSCVIPARVYRPKDKAKVEVSVLVASRWIIAALRNKTFFSIEDLNIEIGRLLAIVNGKKMRIYRKSRLELFNEIDRPALKPLPEVAYEYGEWKNQTLNIDYHIAFDDHYYSAPYKLIKQEVWIRATHATIEIFFKSERVSSHRRSHSKGKFTTDPTHRPPSHKAYTDWTPERMAKWAGASGESVKVFVEKLIAIKVHPEQAYRSVMGIIRLGEKFGQSRLNQACSKALTLEVHSYQVIKNMLKTGVESVPLKNPQKQTQMEFLNNNGNVRGKEYYH